MEKPSGSNQVPNLVRPHGDDRGLPGGDPALVLPRRPAPAEHDRAHRDLQERRDGLHRGEATPYSVLKAQEITHPVC